MISRGLPLVLTVVLFCPSLLRAQGETKAAFDPFRPYASANGAMYEDIEIFRCILDRKLAPLRQQFHVQSNQPSRGNFFTVWAAIEDGPSSLEGIYLKGHGIVYTATLPSLQPAANAQTNEWQKEAKLTQPVSEWESVRRQFRNVKEETKKKPEASKPPTLSDVLLKVLAENGHHFSQLGENENLTLVLTVRDTSSPDADFLKTAKKLKKTGVQSTYSKKEDSSPYPASEIPHSSNFVRDMEVLGDLHLKQGHYEDALKEYQKVARLNPKAEVYRKVAQCYLALEKYQDARSALDRAISWAKEGTQSKPAPSAKPVSAALPMKVIISAPKKLLDQVKEGKITFEEFRGKAHVETLRFDEGRSHK